MSDHTLHIRITDARGDTREVYARAVRLDYGCGCLHLMAGHSPYCRAFTFGIAEIELPHETLRLAIRNGSARLAQDSLHLICESAIETDAEPQADGSV